MQYFLKDTLFARDSLKQERPMYANKQLFVCTLTMLYAQAA